MKKLSFLLLAFGLFFLTSCGGEKPADENAEGTDTTAMEEPAEEPAAEEPQAEAQSIVAVASSVEDFSTLVEAVKAAELVEVLEGEGPFTVFAPTNAAFEALPEGTLENLLKPENKEQLQAVLKYHVVPGKVMAADITDGMEASTAQGEVIKVAAAEGVTLNGTAKVVEADVAASNGVIHQIDAVILPPSMNK